LSRDGAGKDLEEKGQVPHDKYVKQQIKTDLEEEAKLKGRIDPETPAFEFFLHRDTPKRGNVVSQG
jgi:hypothetical protein